MTEIDYKLRHSGQELDDAIDKLLALLVNGKVDGTSVSFDNEEVSGTDSVALNKFNVQELLVNIIKKGVRSIDFSLANGRAYLRYNKLDGDYKTVPLPDADSTYYANAPTALKTAGAALADLYNKVAELQRGGVTPEQIWQAIQDWLDAHPEATTSVPDGSITLAKLATEVKTAIDNAGKIASVEVNCNIEERAEDHINYELNIKAKDKNGEVVSSRYGSLFIPVVSDEGAGLMTEGMLQTLDRLESSATVDVTVVSNASDVKIKRSVVHGSAKEFSLPAATQEKAGVMSSEQVQKLETAVKKAEDLSRLSKEINELKTRIAALENGTPSTPEEPEPDEPTNPDSIVGSVGSGNAIAINNDLGSVELYYLDANDNKLSNYDKIGEL